MNPYYTMQGDEVVIHTALGQGHNFMLNESRLVAAIESVRNNRPAYATEDYWRNDLKMWEDALVFLRNHLTPD